METTRCESAAKRTRRIQIDQLKYHNYATQINKQWDLRNGLVLLHFVLVRRWEA